MTGGISRLAVTDPVMIKIPFGEHRYGSQQCLEVMVKHHANIWFCGEKFWVNRVFMQSVLVQILYQYNKKWLCKKKSRDSLLFCIITGCVLVEICVGRNHQLHSWCILKGKHAILPGITFTNSCAFQQSSTQFKGWALLCSFSVRNCWPANIKSLSSEVEIHASLRP